MATEMRLIPDGKQVTLGELLPGTIFYFDDCIAVKSEYTCRNGLIEAYIVDSGELFWGGAKTVAEQHELMVQPLAIVDVAQGHWIERQAVKGQVYCSECATIEKVTDSNYKSRRCPNCGAKMDGGADHGI